MQREEVNRLLVRTAGLGVFRGVLGSPAARGLLSLLGLLAQERPDPTSVAGTVGRLWEELAVSSEGLLPDAWQSHLVVRLLEDENPFSLAAERHGEPGGALGGQAARDLRTLQRLFELDAVTLLGMVEDALPGVSELWTPWMDPGLDTSDSPRAETAWRLSAEEDWGEVTGILAGHYVRQGAGAFGRYRMFRWRAGGLEPVEEPDPVRLEELEGYERERQPLISNTKRLLAGLPAHHALVYGPPGTGKSSTVKAVINEFSEGSLRAVEVAKEDLGDLPAVLALLRRRGPRFVLFVDDLSFEEHEVEYKALKALLEGSFEAPPENVRLYATSNRRNIVRESFSDRDGDDVHGGDSAQEKVSLAARFALRLTFLAPDQKRYLRMVSGLARSRGLAVPEAELEERALLWDRRHAGRSGRTARQFVDELEAELAGV